MSTFSTSIAPTIHQKIQIPYNYSAGPAMTVFLRGLQQKIIHASLCSGCGRRSVPPLSFCGRCWTPIKQYVPVEQRGTVQSSVFPPELPSDLAGKVDASLGYALIRLEGCDTNLAHLVKAGDAAAIKIGSRVKPVWNEQRSASILDIAYFAVE
jgi:uncharacterized OB-fold protein